jgi:transglutaminase-like putative cysteine protease
VNRHRWFAASLGLLLLISRPVAADEPVSVKARTITLTVAKQRKFTLTCAGEITGLNPGEHVRVWLPVPPTDGDQDVCILRKSLPADGKIAREPVYGNDILHFAAKSDTTGRMSFDAVYSVTRREVRDESQSSPPDAAAVARFLKPDALVPIDGKPLELIRGKEIPKDAMEAARLLYDTVNGHMRYSKEGTDWGRGDSVWACDSRRGNCSDFHSLFISLARSQHIPAKFEIGFALPDKRGSGDIAGYHCWAKFLVPDKGWLPVDISEANKNPALRDYYFGSLTENRVCLSTGRDLQLVPKQDGPPLNFFVFPYAEVGGKPYPQEKIRTRIAFADEK